MTFSFVGRKKTRLAHESAPFPAFWALLCVCIVNRSQTRHRRYKDNRKGLVDSDEAAKKERKRSRR